MAAVQLVLLTIAGCASPSGVVLNSSPFLIGKAVSLDFIRVQTTSAVGGLAAEQQLLNDLIVSELRETQLFPNVSGNPADTNQAAGTKITAEIKAIHNVSDQARDWAGALAGQAQILVQVTVTDLSSGSQIESFAAEGRSGKSAFAGTTDEAIQQAAAQIVAEVVKINAATAP
jgi:hypothetical protein